MITLQGLPSCVFRWIVPLEPHVQALVGVRGFASPVRAPTQARCLVTASANMAAFFSRPTSAAVKIVAPPRPDGSPAPQLSQDQNRTRAGNAPFRSSHTIVKSQKQNCAETLQNLGVYTFSCNRGPH